MPSWISEEGLLKSIGKRLEELREQGLEDTEAYENLSDEWQSLAQNILEGQWLDDEE